MTFRLKQIGFGITIPFVAIFVFIVAGIILAKMGVEHLLNKVLGRPFGETRT